MGTRDMSPLPAKLLKKVRQARALIVEADIAENSFPFAGLPEYPPLEQRLHDRQLKKLQKLTAELGLNISHFTTQPLWQIAMRLQATQAQKLGLYPDYGVDFQLLQMAKRDGVKIIELEGTENQLALLRQMPDNGLALLDDTLTHWHTNARLLQLMVSWWLEKPPLQDLPSLPDTFSQSLYDVLMRQRNLVWKDQLSALPPGYYVVSVGALHLYGKGNLAELLK